MKLQCLKEVIWAEEIAHLGPEFDSPERGEGGEGHTKDRDIIVMYFCIAFATETGKPVRLSGYPEWPFWANSRLVEPYISKANKGDTKIHPHRNKWDKFRTKPKNFEN